MNELKARKDEYRRKYQSLRKDIPAQTKGDLDERIAQRFLSTVSYRHCESLFIYSSTSDEIDTRGIITSALESGKTVALPVSDPSSCTMTFYAISSPDDLVKGTYGIYEPADKSVPCRGGRLSICLVPGIVFDEQGYRIGYGKGYYDRFLQSFDGVKLGLCYCDFYLKEIPRGKYDTRVDCVITEKGIIPSKEPPSVLI